MSAQCTDVSTFASKSKSCGAELRNVTGRGWLVAVILCATIGCSSGIPTNTVLVSGIVSYNGQPVGGAEVALLPAAGVRLFGRVLG